MHYSLAIGSRLKIGLSTLVVIGSTFLTTAVANAASLTWEPLADFMDPRSFSFDGGIEGASASLIGDKIYVSHGFRGFDSDYLSVYDIPTNTWTHGGSSAPDALIGRAEMAGGTANGKHYAIGGRTGPNATVEEFDPNSNTWTNKTSMDFARGGLGAASWNDKIYAIGGRNGGSFGSGAIFGFNEVYDPLSDSWTTLNSIPIPVSDNYATIALDDKVYVFGGATNNSTVISDLQIYDIATDTWSFGTSMPTARAAAMAGVIDGKIAVFGGFNGLTNLAVTELYDPSTDSWSAGPDMLQPTSEMAQGVTYDERCVYSIGEGIFGVSGSSVQRLCSEDRSVPEPASALGVLTFGALSAGWGVLKHQQKKS